ncbi:DUF4383 domain-containing protein [Actinoplanes sp. TRM 88003]|uniref:DUF4383 domain-containing protein n=1 Tax=Paractinoplanes aksuensis TaxID=2939490 RepID=A0ABT1DNT2_9ACTN|nr:DUF4383 domain-containing protein [Actinoplanes aksuensis]MCO8272480.1 DUF4383 domain-containing protein [Actinoplanes aksuensis]
MAHYPLNHPLRPVFRALAFLTGVYLTLVGAIGLGVTAGDPFFHRGSDWVLGLRTNPAAAWLTLLLGVVLLAAVVLGRNVYYRVTLVLGWVLAGYAMITMALIQTDANVLNVSMVNVIVLAALGLVVLTAGLYGKIGTPEAAQGESRAAHGSRASAPTS